MSIVALGWLSSGLRLTLWAALCWCIITGLDKLNGDPFSKDKTRIEDGNMAVAVYRSARWLAVLLGSAAILS